MRTRRNPDVPYRKQFQGADGAWFNDIRDAEWSLRHAHHCGSAFDRHTYDKGLPICPAPSERRTA